MHILFRMNEQYLHMKVTFDPNTNVYSLEHVNVPVQNALATKDKGAWAAYTVVIPTHYILEITI